MKITSWEIIVRSIVIGTTLFLARGYGRAVPKFIKCQCTVHDPTAMQNVSCWAKSINRTFAVANMRGTIIRVLDNFWVQFQLFKRTEVKYRPFLINVTENYCEFFDKNKAGMYLRLVGSIYLPYSNWNHTCPYFGDVYIKDMPMTGDKFPTTWPVGEYRMNAHLIEFRKKILTMEFFLVVTNPPVEWGH